MRIKLKNETVVAYKRHKPNSPILDFHVNVNGNDVFYTIHIGNKQKAIELYEQLFTQGYADLSTYHARF